jgi:hypothetical protein
MPLCQYPTKKPRICRAFNSCCLRRSLNASPSLIYNKTPDFSGVLSCWQSDKRDSVDPPCGGYDGHLSRPMIAHRLKQHSPRTSLRSPRPMPIRECHANLRMGRKRCSALFPFSFASFAWHSHHSHRGVSNAVRCAEHDFALGKGFAVSLPLFYLYHGIRPTTLRLGPSDPFEPERHCSHLTPYGGRLLAATFADFVRAKRVTKSSIRRPVRQSFNEGGSFQSEGGFVLLRS